MLGWSSDPPGFTWAGSVALAITSVGSQDTTEGETPSFQNAEGDSVSVQVNASDPNVYNPLFVPPPTLTFDAVGLPSGLSIDHSTGLITGTIDYSAAEAFGGVYTPTIVVADSLGASASQTCDWAVTDTVRSPVFTPVNDQTNAIGDTVSLQVSATQPDGDQLVYDDSGLPSGLTIDSSTGLISGTVADDAVSGAATITATDTKQTPAGQDVFASTTFNWNLITVHSPQLTAPPSQTNAAGDVVSLPISATDSPGNTPTYSATGLPDGLSIDPASGVISGTLQNDAASDAPYNVTVSMTDGTEDASQAFSWTVNYVGVTNPGDQANAAGDLVSLPITTVDASDVSPTYSASGLPQGLGIDPTSGIISGTLAPVGESDVTSAVTVTATDGLHSGSTTFNWDVAPPTLPDRTDLEGATVSIQAPVDYAGATPTFAATGLPSGVAIDPNSGLISGAIAVGDAAAGPYDVTVTTTYSPQDVNTQEFTWTIHPVENVAPTLTAPGDQTTIAGTQASLALSASDSTDEDATDLQRDGPAGRADHRPGPGRHLRYAGRGCDRGQPLHRHRDRGRRQRRHGDADLQLDRQRLHAGRPGERHHPAARRGGPVVHRGDVHRPRPEPPGDGLQRDDRLGRRPDEPGLDRRAPTAATPSAATMSTCIRPPDLSR